MRSCKLLWPVLLSMLELHNYCCTMLARAAALTQGYPPAGMGPPLLQLTIKLDSPMTHTAGSFSISSSMASLRASHINFCFFCAIAITLSCLLPCRGPAEEAVDCWPRHWQGALRVAYLSRSHGSFH